MATRVHPLTVRACSGITLFMLAYASVASGQAPAAAPSPLVLLVSSSHSEPEAIEGFSTAIRAQLGDAVQVRVYETTPPRTDELELRAWSAALAEDTDAQAVVWMEPGEQDTEIVLWILIHSSHGDDLQRLRVSEPNDFDRFRSLAIGARALLGELLERAPAENEAPLTPAVEVEPPEEEPREPETPPRGEPRRDPSDTPGLALHAALGPTLRASSGHAALGVNARVGLRLGANLSILVGLDFTREERFARWTRNRLALRTLVMGTLPLGPAYLSLGAGGALVLARVGSAERRSPTSELAGSVTLLGAAGFHIFDDLFLELPVSLDLRYAGSSATPRSELSVGLMLGFGTP